jgi:MFS family permease
MSASPRVVLLWACAAQASVSLLTLGLPAIGPDLREEYGLTLAGLGAVLTAALLGAGVSLLGLGIAVDRYGGRATTLAGSLLAAAAVAAAAFTQSGAVLVGLLFVTGLGMAAVPIAGIGSLFRAFDASKRAWALGMRQTAVPVGGVIGALLLPGLVALGGVRLALIVCSAAIGLTSLGLAAVAGAASGTPAAPLSRLRRIWQTPGIRRLLVVAALYVIVLQSTLSFTVPSARAAGLSAFLAGATFVVVNVTSGIARVVWGLLADRAGGTRRVQMMVGAGSVAATGGVLFALSLHFGALVVFPAAILFSFGALGWNALVYVSAGERAGPELASQSVALAATIVFVCGAVSTPPLGALAEHAGWDVFWITNAGLAGIGALVASRLPRAAPYPSSLTAGITESSV